MSETRRGRLVRAGIIAVLAIVLLRLVSCGPSHTFNISGGALATVSPGTSMPLDVELVNPHRFPIRISGLTVRVASINAPRSSEAHACSAGDFTVGQARQLQTTVAAGTSVTLSGLDLPSGTWPRLHMINSSVNQDGCKGASLALKYSATAVRDR